jgi:hypothetical protein
VEKASFRLGVIRDAPQEDQHNTGYRASTFRQSDGFDGVAVVPLHHQPHCVASCRTYNRRVDMRRASYLMPTRMDR